MAPFGSHHDRCPAKLTDVCGAISPRGTTCIEPVGHEQRTSHGDGSVIHWLTPDQRANR
jgi:hypothetical protein